MGLAVRRLARPTDFAACQISREVRGTGDGTRHESYALWRTSESDGIAFSS